jgi:hypothetical protein
VIFAAHHPLDREVLGVTGAAEQLHDVGGDLHRHIGGVALRRRCHEAQRRRPFAEYRFTPEAVAGAGDAFQEMWFAGVHGDIGGQCRADDRLPDIAFSWMVKEADRAGFHVDKAKYRRLVKVDFNKELPTNWRSALSVLSCVQQSGV